MFEKLRSKIPIDILNKEIDLENFISKARIEIDKNGYFIAKKLISNEWYHSCRKEAIEYFNKYSCKKNDLPTALRGNVSAGMADLLGYEKNTAWHLFRYCGFRWNKPNIELIKVLETSHSLSRIRNVIYGNDLEYGDFIEENNFFTYTSLSLYPLGGGFLNKHIDFKPSWNIKPMIHFKVELTHKGKDYNNGGLYLTDKSNNSICLSDYVDPTDIIFFEGSQPHEIKPTGSGKLGRIAFFEIPASVIPSSRKCIYSGDGISFPKKVLIKIINLL
ncbi:hypothetical protein [Prochlorococcus marinus]|uniref:hypothetical protein n=1 Tax=Prochlorococcus marinus TaxID=1219 RepID=UPI001ADAEE55|nr:hypothetical protein [Prochlorococcus marinus]MBO8219573.1 hypothetical protein [Prochlorococcus marinus CUG1416]MBW3051946.1 hypothetical protein [Prochlorococcus marinus str. MU1416]